MPSNDCVLAVLELCLQTTNLFAFSHTTISSLFLLLAIVLGCSLLFVHDGAASTAIWLIKSVIELCDMNNLLLFSLLSLAFFPSPFRFLPRRIFQK